MNKWLLRLSRATGLMLVLLTLTSALWPAPPATRDQKTSLALRQIGHNYLSLLGDSTTRIPAVEENEDGTLLLRLEQKIAYDTLNRIARSVLADYDIRADYTLSLEDCSSGEVFLGSLWPGVRDDEYTDDSERACMGRDQENRCANIILAFATKQEAGTPFLTWFLGGLGVLLFFAGRLSPAPPHVTTPAPEPDLVPEQPGQLRLGEDCTFDETAHLLTIGTVQHELTYREAKLFGFFANRPNEILARADINEAVWGEEGIITGRSLDVFVSRLRKKLATTEHIEIKTVHGVGYRLLVG
ncbi:winged helix-turn-helix domain-containing protein [Neolewinella aurantiaca]|nr:winged helix-turn-helix domain-containing protein [Neolewinella aurantiaca]